ncbi:serine hydrolase domain-containing protein [Phenylobacterium sp.]|jgi:CubicO group peptidase (beta-lactamase class C family)|uniref:serine hydrolase domain-containing protein n=1 Tax=Phenylobacterium sp. TaxID=1871053 RepID=UPI002F3EC9F3
MKIDRRAVVGLGLAGAGLAAASSAAAQGAATGVFSVEHDEAGRYGAALADIRAYAARHVAANTLPGLTLSVIAPGGMTAQMRFGYANLDAREPLGPRQLFQIGSISKSFTALCVFHLMEQGKLSLDEDAASLLPSVPWPSGARITVQNLLNHSSGLPDDAPLFPRGGDGRLWRGFEPGAQWSYSNLGFRMLGMMVERLEQKPLAEVIRLRVLQPLGMTTTHGAILTGDRSLYAHGYSPLYGDRPYPRGGPLGPGPWTDMVDGSGCVASTAADMALYARWLAEAGQGKGGPVLSDAAAARFTRATIDAPGWAVKGAKYANGLAVVPLGGRMVLHHTGGMLAFNSALHVDPQAGVGAFASTNIGLAPYRPRDLTAYACARLREVVEGGPKAEAAPMPPPRPDVSAYLGHYMGANGAPVSVTENERGIVLRMGETFWALEPEGDDVFISGGPAVQIRPLVFHREGAAVVRAWFGGDEFVRLGAGGPVAPFSPKTPPELAALAATYTSDDPWHGTIRVYAQGERLVVDGTDPLVRLGDGSWRLGEKDWSPERIRFDGLVDGRPTRAVVSGVDHVRRWA